MSPPQHSSTSSSAASSRLLLVLSLISSLILSTSSLECSQLSTCGDCLVQNTSCFWCNDQDVFARVAVSGNPLQPAQLCGTLEELAKINCPMSAIIPNTTNSQQDGIGEGGSGSGGQLNFNTSSQVLPSTQTFDNIRPGDPRAFTISIQPPLAISVDMYVLMDLSGTMQNDLQNVRSTAVQLVERMQNLTDSFRIGFGSFIDKPVRPFIDSFKSEYPCAVPNALQPIPRNECTPTYAFRHHLTLTENAQSFQQEVDASRLSGSEDVPESVLEAIVQVAVCQDEIGWRDFGSTRRIILVLTDGTYHFALDGRLAGLLNRPDATCKVNANGDYTGADTVDYPSPSFVAEQLLRERITPIFAVTSDVEPLYRTLRRDFIPTAFIGQVSVNSDNLLNLVESQYIQLSRTIVPLVTELDDDDITITLTPVDNCAPGRLVNGTTDRCTDVLHPNVISYTTSVSVSPAFCVGKPALVTLNPRVLFIGFGEVSLTLNIMCGCDCAAQQKVASDVCNGNGNFQCSTCVCQDDLVGPRCNCSDRLSLRCRAPGSSATDPECSGQGRCVCGECRCNQVSSPVSGLARRDYMGAFCQCSPFRNVCPTGIVPSRNVSAVCSGRGNCGCDGRCECDQGYTGANCGCTLDNSTCIAPGETKMCSGSGSCVCGVCICSNYTERSGDLCETCQSCVRSCQVLAPCVQQCLLERTNCNNNCPQFNLYNSTRQLAGFREENYRNCSVVRDNCEVIFRVDQFVLATEESIDIVIDTSNRDYQMWVENADQCTQQLVIWPIPVGVVIGIIIIGIIIVVSWRLILYLGEYVEYKNWEKSQENEPFTRGNNPLFISPNTSYQNPRYVEERNRPIQS